MNEIQFSVPADCDVGNLVSRARSLVADIECKYSRYRDESVISRINAAAGAAAVAIDPETEKLLDFADRCYQKSAGLFDISSGVLRRVWDFKTKQIPSKEMLQSVLPLIGWEKVQRSPGTIRLPQQGMEIDFGGIGKEYAVDCVAELLRSEGIKTGIVNFAGDLRVLGPKPNGVPWNVGIVNPRIQGGTIATVSMRAGALASSGDYERFFECEGQRYCHILNPRTGWPVSDLQSVSIFAETCLEAGSYSTIAMLLGAEHGIKFLRDAQVSYLVVQRDGKIVHELSTKMHDHTQMIKSD